MTHELKIVLGATVADTHIFVDDKQVGFIQDINVHVSTEQTLPIVDIVFPDLREYNRTATTTLLQEQIELLKGIPNVRISFRPLKFDEF